MIIKITNKSKNFYAHLGRVFGSREIERLTNDKAYDDDGKDWYVYYKRGTPVVFVSVIDGVIKNVWGEDRKRLVDVLKKIKTDLPIKNSVVTKYFEDEYIKAGFTVENKSRNFINIRSGEIE